MTTCNLTVSSVIPHQFIQIDCVKILIQLLVGEVLISMLRKKKFNQVTKNLASLCLSTLITKTPSCSGHRKFAGKIVVKVYSQKHKSLLFTETFTSLLVELFDLMREGNVFQTFITFLFLNSSRSDDSKRTCTRFASK